MSEAQERQVIQKIIETVLHEGVYDTEERYVWLICCISRIFLQKTRPRTTSILESKVFGKYLCESLYHPVKLQKITQELVNLTHDNVFNISILVEKLNHINPVLHYVCISLVSVGMRRVVASNTDFFHPLKPEEVISLLDTFIFTQETLDFVVLFRFQRLLSLYHSLVIMNKMLRETHPPDLVKFLTENRSFYLKSVKKWLHNATDFLNTVMTSKKMCSSLVSLKQELLIELQLGLRDHVNEEDVMVKGC